MGRHTIGIHRNMATVKDKKKKTQEARIAGTLFNVFMHAFYKHLQYKGMWKISAHMKCQI